MEEQLKRKSWILSLAIISLLLRMSQAEYFLEYQLTEGRPPGSPIGNVFIDTKLHRKYNASVQAKLRFTFMDKTKAAAKYFTITNTGALGTATDIDRDRLCPNMAECDLKVDISMQPWQYFKVIHVTVHVKDVNDNRPIFPTASVTRVIPEIANIGDTYTLPIANDPDSGKFSVQQYKMISSTNKFELIDSNSAGIKFALRQKLDREKQDNYQFIILAIDGGRPALTGSCTVTVQVLDVNDNHPVFVKQRYEVEVPENLPAGSTITRVKATDRDVGLNGRLEYYLNPQSQTLYGNIFGINRTKGGIYLKKQLDFEDKEEYEIGVVARDQGPGGLSDEAQVKVKVVDVNDHSPEVTIRSASGDSNIAVSEAAPIKSFVAQISVVDSDKGKNGEVSCHIQSDDFKLTSVYSSEFHLTTNRTLDRETKATYSVPLICTDKGEKPKSTSTLINITMLDINDNAPLFHRNRYEASITENNPRDQLVISLNATDADDGLNGQIEYSIDPKSRARFYITPQTGQLRAKFGLDYERDKRLVVEVIARDRGKPVKSSTASVVIRVIDANDEPPYFKRKSWEFKVHENQPPSHAKIGKVQATDRDGHPFNDFIYSIAPKDNARRLFKINPLTGEISPTKVLDYEEQRYYSFNITVISTMPPLSIDTAKVKITLIDMNDNAPIFVYPTDENNTIHISPELPVGFTVTRVKAVDKDSGINGNFNFLILSGNKRGHFTVNNTTGDLSIAKKFNKEESFSIIIMARDHGFPTKSSVAKLHLIVNGTVPYDKASHSLLTEQGRTVIIAMAAACSAVVLALLMAICIIVTRKHHFGGKPPRPRYQVKVETQSPDHHPMPLSRNLQDTSLGSKQLENNYRGPGRQLTPPAPPNNNASFYTGYSQPPNLMPATAIGCSPARSTKQGYNNEQQKSTTSDNSSSQQKECKVQHWLNQLSPDTDSSCSVEGSNTDSGRGASEEGENNGSMSPTAFTTFSPNPPPSLTQGVRNTDSYPRNPNGIMNHPYKNKNNGSRTVRFGDEPTIHSYVGARGESPIHKVDRSSPCVFIEPSPEPVKLPCPPGDGPMSRAPRVKPHSKRHDSSQAPLPPPRGGATSASVAPKGHMEPPYMLQVLKENYDTTSVDSSTTSGSYIVEGHDFIRFREAMDPNQATHTVV